MRIVLKIELPSVETDETVETAEEDVVRLSEALRRRVLEEVLAVDQDASVAVVESD